MKSGHKVLRQAADVFEARNKVYGDNYIRLGNMMQAQFPKGLTIKTAEEWTRLYFFLAMNVKASRYATNFKTGGHADSSIDASVYAAMLHGYDDK